MAWGGGGYEGVSEEEEEVGERYPEPALFDEEDVEDVGFGGEVGGAGRWVGLCCWVVG